MANSSSRVGGQTQPRDLVFKDSEGSTVSEAVMKVMQLRYGQSKLKPLVNFGTYYPSCAEKDLEQLLHPRGSHDIPTLSIGEAVHHVVSRSLPRDLPAISRIYRQEIGRLQYAFDAANVSWHPDVIFKAFRDLDKVLFDGLLRGNVSLCWAGKEEMETVRAGGGAGDDLLGGTSPVDSRKRPGIYRQSKIFLVRDQLLTVARFGLLDVWETLVHEMIVSTSPVPDLDVISNI